ncbi:MAG: LysM domain-containing protein [Chitinophagales bacterium]
MEGETMHDIAQKYGIKLIKLYRRNKMPLNSRPIAGEIVQLQNKVKASPKYRM